MRRLPRPRPDRRRHLLLPDAALDARRRAQPLPHPAAQGQARQPLQRLQRGRVRRRLGADGRRGGPRRADDHRDGQPHPPRLRDRRRHRLPGRRRPGPPPHRPPLRLRRRADRPAADAQRPRRPLRRVRGGHRRGDAAGPRLRRGRRRRRGRDRVPPPRQRRAQVLALQAGPDPTRSSALECLGGNGYVEESGMPRLFRESPLASIWEGSGNVQCLDVLRAMVKSPGLRRRLLRRGPRGRRRRAAARRLRHLPARRDPRRHRDDPVPRPPRGRAHGPGPPSLACWSATATRRSPTPSAPPASAATGATPSAPCRPAPTSSASSSATARSRPSHRPQTDLLAAVAEHPGERVPAPR